MSEKWLFFDIGSTLVDESKCIQNRCQIITSENNIDPQEFYDKVLEFAKNDAHAVKCAAKYYGVEIPKWNTALEHLYPNVDSVLKALSNKYKLGIIANQCLGAKDRLDNWGIGKYFDVIALSAEEGCAKPDLKIFEIALERADCKPDEAVMIGDRLDNDIVPAKQIGMKTIWIKQGFAVDQKAKSAMETPDCEIIYLTELLKIL